MAYTNGVTSAGDPMMWDLLAQALGIDRGLSSDGGGAASSFDQLRNTDSFESWSGPSAASALQPTDPMAQAILPLVELLVAMMQYAESNPGAPSASDQGVLPTSSWQTGQQTSWNPSSTDQSTVNGAVNSAGFSSKGLNLQSADDCSAATLSNLYLLKNGTQFTFGGKSGEQAVQALQMSFGLGSNGVDPPSRRKMAAAMGLNLQQNATGTIGDILGAIGQGHPVSVIVNAADLRNQATSSNGAPVGHDVTVLKARRDPSTGQLMFTVFDPGMIGHPEYEVSQAVLQNAMRGSSYVESV